MPMPKIFISYAHEDIRFLDELVKRLKPLKRRGEIILWHDGVIKPGEEWNAAIKEQLESADIIIILLSIDFTASDYISEHELPRIIERREKGEIQLIPIVVRNVNLKDLGIEMYQCLPQDDKRRLKPIIEWDERMIDKVWMQVDKKIREVIDRFNNTDSEDVATPPPLQSSLPLEEVTAKDLTALKKGLKKEIVKDIDLALDKLDKLISPDSYLYNSLIQLQAQHSRYKRDNRMQIITKENANIQQARITYAFQSLVDELDDDDLV